jgi:hypothetical protein
MTEQELDLYLDPVLQAHFETVKGEWQVGDLWVLPQGTVVHRILDIQQLWEVSDSPLPMWLPLAIDTENPERGLCGMLGKSWYLSCREGIYCCYAGQYSYEADTPIAALLIALRAQIGGKP